MPGLNRSVRSSLPLAMLLALLLALVPSAACSSRNAPSPPSEVTPTTTPAPSATATPAPEAKPATSTVFAVIGDYGTGDAHARAVARLVSSWRPAWVIATGDDYYRDAGGTGTARYDRSTGRYYCAWLKDVSTTGSLCRVGKASKNAFFPCLGNHDYSDARPAPATYLDYFDLPGAGFANSSGNERYYDFVEDDVHFFVLNSNADEPNGTDSTSEQAAWLRAGLARSKSRWNFVYDHHPPYSSDTVHGSTSYMQWPFSAWGADAVLSGHAHVYERVMRNGIVYFVNGLGGQRRYAFGKPVAGSKVRYDADWGAQKVSVSATSTTFEFFAVNGQLVDRFVLRK